MDKKTTKRLVLGEGEGFDAQGVIKKHVLVSDSEIEYDHTLNSIKMMLAELGVLTHDEHDRMVFTPGKYRSYNQVEFNPMDGTVSRVFD